MSVPYSKVLICGAYEVGKSSLIKCIIKEGAYQGDLPALYTSDSSKYRHKGRELRLIDMLGQEHNTSVPAFLSKGVAVSIVVYAVDDEDSPRVAAMLYESIRRLNPTSKFIIVGNKVDLPRQHPECAKERVMAHFPRLTDERMFIEVSAHKYIGITDLLDLVVELVRLCTKAVADASSLVCPATSGRSRVMAVPLSLLKHAAAACKGIHRSCHPKWRLLSARLRCQYISVSHVVEWSEF